MKKIILLFCCCLLCPFLLHAQNSSTANGAISNNKNWQAFTSIALSPTDHDGQVPVIRKWQSPIHYKIYGTTNNAENDKKIAEYIALTFRKLTPLTGLDISSTEDDNQVNIFLLIGRPEEVSGMTLPKAAPRFSPDSAESHCYYTTAKNSYVRMLTYINPDDSTLIKYRKKSNPAIEHINAAVPPSEDESANMQAILTNNSTNGRRLMVVAGKGRNISNAAKQQHKLQNLWCEVRLMLMKSLGFNGVTDDLSSLFTNNFSQRLASQKVITSDAVIIKALYNPAVKPGMTEQEVYTVIGSSFVK